jgi:hypothetical protein
MTDARRVACAGLGLIATAALFTALLFVACTGEWR